MRHRACLLVALIGFLVAVTTGCASQSPGFTCAAAAGACVTGVVGSQKPGPAFPEFIRAQLVPPESSPINIMTPARSIDASTVDARVNVGDVRYGLAVPVLPDESGLVYPVRSIDHGASWQFDGPALGDHDDYGYGGEYITADSAGTVVAWGRYLDVATTADGGAHWYQTSFPGRLAGSDNFQLGGGVRQAVTTVGDTIVVRSMGDCTGPNAPIRQYVSRDQGRTWHRLGSAPPKACPPTPETTPL